MKGLGSHTSHSHRTMLLQGSAHPFCTGQDTERLVPGVLIPLSPSSYGGLWTVDWVSLKILCFILTPMTTFGGETFSRWLAGASEDLQNGCTALITGQGGRGFPSLPFKQEKRKWSSVSQEVSFTKQRSAGAWWWHSQPAELWEICHVCVSRSSVVFCQSRDPRYFNVFGL
jgi:hypothetical protein